jgi:ADP-sugar diphosphatase
MASAAPAPAPAGPLIPVASKPMFGKEGNISAADGLAFAQRLPAFQQYLAKLTAEPGLSITSVKILDVYPFGPDVTKALRGFVTVEVAATKGGKRVPGFALIRGASVAVLVVLVNEEKNEYVVTTTQPRIPGAVASYEEIPAGMLDGGEFKFVATKELEEELGLTISVDALIPLTTTYPSIGGCDEAIAMYVFRGQMPDAKIREFQGKHTGAAGESEDIITKLRTYDEFKGACLSGVITDMKALTALGLYELKGTRSSPPTPYTSVANKGGARRTRRRLRRKHSRR